MSQLQDHISPDDLRALLHYNPETGELIWLPRSVRWFSDGVKRTSQHICDGWNAQFAWTPALTAYSNGYKIGGVLGFNAAAHIVAWTIWYGEWPENEIDHENGDRGDNRIKNLRDVTKSVNQRNKKKPVNNTSGAIGVYYESDRNKWRVRAKHAGKVMCFGRFDTFEEAVEVRKSVSQDLGYHPNHGRTAEASGDPDT